MGFYLPPFPYEWMYEAITFGLADAILVLMVWRPQLAPQHRLTYALGLAAFPLAHLAWFTVVQGSGWRSFAQWFRALPLT